MTITDKTRKVLWGRSGNRCAICRQPLVVDRTSEDDHSVVGDECHIHSGASNGPRHDPTLDLSKVDNIDNLLLLCRVHHKMVDDQFETYVADLLRTIKRNHEQWVNAKFDESEKQEGVRIVRLKNHIPTHLMPIESGHELFNIVSGCHGHYPHHSDDLSDEEIELVGGFIQNVKDWADLGSDLEPVEKLRAGKALFDEIQLLQKSGFRVFGVREKQQLRGGINPPSNFHVFHIAVVRESDATIVPMPENREQPNED